MPIFFLFSVRIGDFCSSNIDCNGNANSYCFDGICSCAPGFKQVTTWLEASEPSLVCIESSENLLMLGEQCNSTTVSFGNRHCQPPLVCHRCATGSYMCVGKVLFLKWPLFTKFNLKN